MTGRRIPCVLFYDSSAESLRAKGALERKGEGCSFFDVEKVRISAGERITLPWLVTPEGEFAGLSQIMEFLSLRQEGRLHSIRERPSVR